MKKTKIIIMAVATVVSLLVGVQSGSAQEFYKAVVNAVSISTNQEGNLIQHEFNNWSIISTVADEQGITNLTGLSLVYDRTADALEVVSGTNDTLVSTVLTFSGGVSLSNTNETKIERLAGVYWETNETVGGTLLAEELIPPVSTLKPDAFNWKRQYPAAFSLQGQLQFMVPANGTNAPVIYAGSISAETGSWGRY